MALQIFLFCAACLVIWQASKYVIRGVEAFSKSFRISSFAVSVFLLGILTSLTELSVGVQAVAEGKPEIFVGNLIGGSYVLLMFVIPLLVLLNKGIVMKNHLTPRELMLFLLLIVSPSFMVLDGTISGYDALFLLMLYGAFFYLFEKSSRMSRRVLEAEQKKGVDKGIVLRALAYIVGGALLIYGSGIVLVDSLMAVATALRLSPFYLSLIVLPFGTNLPELVIAFRSAMRKESDVAFGDYVGSAAANPLIFAGLTLASGPFSIQNGGFSATLLLIVLGYGAFFVFARTKNRISVIEGLVLLCVFLLYLITDIGRMVS